MNPTIPAIPEIDIYSLKLDTLEVPGQSDHEQSNNNALVILGLIEGGTTFSSKFNSNVELEPGDIVLISSPTDYSFSNENKQQATLFTIAIPFCNNKLPNIDTPTVLIPKSERSRFPGVWKLVSALLEVNSNPNKLKQGLLIDIAKSILKIILSQEKYKIADLKEVKSSYSNQEDRVRKVIHAMHFDLARQWTLEDFSAISNLSATSLNIHFKRVTGYTPLKYLIKMRIEQAKSLLRGSSKSIMEIAHLSGYKSDSAFNKVFKRKVGITPDRYRKAIGVIFPTKSVR